MWSCTWSNKRVKSCYCVRSRLSTDQDDLWRDQPVVQFKFDCYHFFDGADISLLKYSAEYFDNCHVPALKVGKRRKG